MFRAIISYEARVGETYATDSREEPRYLDMTVPVVNLYQLVAVLSESANRGALSRGLLSWAPGDNLFA